MSTTTPSSASSATTAHAAQTNARPGAPGQRKPGAQDAADLFASMLTLLSATDDTPAIPLVSDAALGDPVDLAATPQAQGDATLAAMMQWAGLPQAGGAARGAAGTKDVLTADPSASGTTARAAAGAGADSLPQGMQVLAQAETPDAQTLAALSNAPAEGAGEVGTPNPLVSESAAAGAATTLHAHAGASRPANSWRGQPPATATQALQQTHHDTAQVDRLQVRVHTEVAAAVRSTVALDERFVNTAALSANPSEASPTTATGASAIAAASSAGSGGSDLSGQHGGDGDTGPQTTASDHKLSDEDANDAEPWVDEDWAQAQEKLDAFASPSLRQASLRVGEAGEDAIDIQLSLNGQELSLGFRTDNADARAALARHADGSLSELLQRGGIQLGDVSVGSQNGQSAGSHSQQAQVRSQPSAAPGQRGSSSDADAMPSAALQPRRDGNRPLDMFV
jgi:flagellar hook-length control protein FliK